MLLPPEQGFTMQGMLRILIADICATVVVYAASLIFGNATIYDPYWSVAPLVIIPSICIYLGTAGVGSALICALVALWSVRLTANWVTTFRDLSTQDWRYDMLKKRTGAFFPVISFLGIQMFPTIVVYGVIVPAVMFVKTPDVNLLTCLGAIVSLFGIFCEFSADNDLRRFHADDTGSSAAVIERGLWRYSRHPNYFGEILMWWGIYFMMLSVRPDMWYLLAGALVNTLMFLFISIPMEERRLRSRKAGYAEYAKTTSALIPMRRRHG